MTQKPKRKLKNIDFSDDTSHIALVSKHQGGPANGADYSLVLKNLNNPSPEFIQKMQQIQVTYELPDFLRKVMGMYYEDAELLARMMGYVEPEKEEDDYEDWYENYIEEKLQSFTIIKSLHEAKNLPEALSKLTEQDYLDVLQDQMLIEKALKTELDKEEKPSKADTSTNVENTKVGASASRVNKKKEKQMTQETEMVEKSALTAIEKAMQETQVELQKAKELVKQFEDEKKEAIVKSKTDAVAAVVHDEKHVATIMKAAAKLDNTEDFDALLEVFKSITVAVEKSALFNEQGATVEVEDKAKESKVKEFLKSKYAQKGE